jgi:hypothetical protein
MKKLMMVVMALMLSGCVGDERKLVKTSAQIGCLKACHVFMDGPKLTDLQWKKALNYCESVGNEVADQTSE